MNGKSRGLIVAAVASLALAWGAGCSSGAPKRDDAPTPRKAERREQAKSGDLGRVSRQEDTSQVTVERTVREQVDMPTVRTTGTRADLNRVEPQHLAALGFPPDVAEKVVRYRDRNGRFESVEELRNVEGMTEALYRSVSPKLTT